MISNMDSTLLIYSTEYMLVKAYTNKDSPLAPSKKYKAREQDASKMIWKMEKLTAIGMDQTANY
jgi:hypothetical protein